MKRLLSCLLILALLLSLALPALAAGDGNIDGGGGQLGYGTSTNYWNFGMEGVRVSVVNAGSGATVSEVVDFTNKVPSSGLIHFGKCNKIAYNSGAALTPIVGNYDYTAPAQHLPQIISSGDQPANINAIRNYFTDEYVLRSIADFVGFNYDTMVSGPYRLLIEPLAFVCYRGQQYALTATEAALYDRQVSGDLRSKLTSLTHKNLPLALFLEQPDLGYPAWGHGRSVYVTNDQILSSLGIGLVRFTAAPTPVAPHTYDYEYRVDTDVITSVTVSGGQADPDNPVEVEFEIEGVTYTVDNVFYPDGDSQLVWVKWHTPSVPKVCTIRVWVSGGSPSQDTILANIVSLDGNDPPNPVADDRNDSFHLSAVPSRPQVTSASWGVWSPWWKPKWVWIENWEECPHSEWVDTSYLDASGHYVIDGYMNNWSHWVDNGHWEDQGWWEFDYDSYSASLSASMSITPDDLSPTATGSVLKSGYGVQESVSAYVTTSQSSAVTAAQNAVTYFPEFAYRDYWRLLDANIYGKNSSFAFKSNPFSTFNRPTHFTPIWFPDGDYTPNTWLLDCWTPVGMLSMNLTDTVTVSGNLWEEWHIAPLT